MRKFIPNNLSEGLITSYPIHTEDGSASASKYLKSKFSTISAILPYTKSPYWISKTSLYDKGDSTYSIYVRNLSQLSDIVDFCDRTLGWLTIGVMVDYITESDFYNMSSEYSIENPRFKLFARYPNTDDYRHIETDSNGHKMVQTLSEFLDTRIRIYNYQIVVEAKFTKRTEDFNNLFHVTDGTALLKISKMGLVPRTRGSQTERVYFSRDYRESLNMLKNTLEENNAYILAMNPKYKSEWIKKYTFYEDPRDDKSVYTYDNIDPKYLVLDTGDGEFMKLSDLTISAK